MNKHSESFQGATKAQKEVSPWNKLGDYVFVLQNPLELKEDNNLQKKLLESIVYFKFVSHKARIIMTVWHKKTFTTNIIRANVVKLISNW